MTRREESEFIFQQSKFSGNPKLSRQIWKKDGLMGTDRWMQCESDPRSRHHGALQLWWLHYRNVKWGQWKVCVQLELGHGVRETLLSGWTSQHILGRPFLVLFPLDSEWHLSDANRLLLTLFNNPTVLKGCSKSSVNWLKNSATFCNTLCHFKNIRRKQITPATPLLFKYTSHTECSGQR